MLPLLIPLMFLLQYNATICVQLYGANYTMPCWQNYTITQNQSNPIIGVLATDQQGGPGWFFFYFYLTIAISIAIFMIATSAPDRYFERFSVAMFINMIISFLFTGMQVNGYSLMPPAIATYMIFVFILSVLANWLFG